MQQNSKLVRDKIPEIIRADGREPVVHSADAEEYRMRLRAKLEEEVAEFLRDENVEELADILEVLHALAKQVGADKDELEMVREKKFQKRGGFEKRIVLDEA